LSIAWGEYDKKLYEIARSLPGSKWDSPNVVVKVQYWKEVEDFANVCGFKISERATKAIEREKTKEKTIVVPAKIKKEKPKNRLKELLSDDSEILEDLRD
jgi:hypothetical protein